MSKRAKENWPQSNLDEVAFKAGKIDNRETRRAAQKLKITVPILIVMRAGKVLLREQRRISAAKVVRFLKATPNARP